MKRRFTLALVAVAAIAVIAVATMVTGHDPLSITASLFHDHGHAWLATGLVTLRAELTALETRAATLLEDAKKEGLKAEEIRAIEADHEKVVKDIAAKRVEITAAEEAERNAPPAGQVHAWSAAEVVRIKARAAGFGLDASVAMDLMADDKYRSLDAITDALQERAVGANGGLPRQRPQAQLVADEGDKHRAAVSDALMLRANPRAIAGTDTASLARISAARQFRGMSLLEMGRDFLRTSRGVDLRGLSKMETATVLLGLRSASDFGIQVRSGGMMSTSDFANVLANVASKRLRDAYNAAPQTWKPFCRQSNNPDFKTKSVVQLSSAPVFKRVREGGEFSYGGMADGVEQYALATYGRIIPISRQTLINDDLGAFDRLPMMIGRQAASLENSTVYGVLTANANMNDGNPLFDASHANLLTGSAIDETNLGLAEKALMDQVTLGAKTEDQEKMTLRPAFLVTGTAYKIAAQKILTAVLPTATSGVNVFQGTMQPIVDANIPGNKWFVIADPADIDTIEYAYLEGEEGVFIEQRIGFEVDGLEIKGRLDFAAKPIDWRGMAYNPGA